jgi:DNA-directed RNA polymerase specialized sigma subunit
MNKLPKVPAAPNIDDLYLSYKKSRNKASATALVSGLQPTIDKALHTYGYKDDPLMKTTAQLYALESVDTFDPTKEASLPSYVFTRMQRLQRLGAQQANAIPIPERAALDMKHLTDNEGELTDSLGRAPTMQELADKTGVSTKRIGLVRGKYSRPSRLEQFEGAENDVSVMATQHSNFEDLWMDMVYDTLPITDKKIMEHTLGLKGAPVKSKVEIAAELGISPAAVTQRAQRIAAKLEEGSKYRDRNK